MDRAENYRTENSGTDNSRVENGKIANDIIICRCEEVTKGEILAAIADGATSVKGVKIRTEAGMGLCQGRTCRRLISQMLAQTLPPSDIYPPTIRTPVRTAKIREFTNVEDDS
jgi:NAD(P)H-nitrite reductase large subunit